MLNQLFFISGDSPFYFPEQLKSLSWLPQVWNGMQDFGMLTVNRMWYDYPLQLTIKLISTLGLPWWVIDKLFWSFGVVLAVVCAYILAKAILHSRLYSVISSIIYVINTYFLMIFSGGQYGVMLGYALAPLVLLSFVEHIEKINGVNSKNIILHGLLFSFLIAVDLRIAYLVVIASFIYLIIFEFLRCQSYQSFIRNTLYRVLFIYVVPLLLSGFIHAYWILPMILFPETAFVNGEAFTGIGMVRFLSTSDFSHSISFLHPNWPENLFGKIYFMQPEFLIIPVIAFSGLMYLRHRKSGKSSPRMYFFALLGLVGAFCAKGVNPPFGMVYEWLFTLLPGFVMFRDPTKFYVYIAIAYSILIPYTLVQLCISLRKWRMYIVITFFLVWCFSVRELFTGQLTWNFRLQKIPPEYEQLKNMLIGDSVASRTLWIPSAERVGYMSLVHPALSTTVLFAHTPLSEFPEIATSSSFLRTISLAGVRYVVVPSDIKKTMFLNDYVFDPTLRKQIVTSLGISRLQPVTGYQDIDLYVNPEFNGMQDPRPQNLKQIEIASARGLEVTIISVLVCLIFLWF